MSKLSKLLHTPTSFFSDMSLKKYFDSSETDLIVQKIDKEVNTSPKVAKASVVKEKKVTKTPAATSKKAAPSKPKAKEATKAKPAVKKAPAATTKSIFSAQVNQIPVANISLRQIEVVLYFPGSIGNIYQVEQWIEVLKEVNKEKPLLLVVRSMEVFEWLSRNTHFTVVYCKTIQDLTQLYEDNNFKAILYVNQGFKNFQSLISGTALHIHINHGESDKTSTITNQSKAYDYVFIVGDAAYDKYKLNLIKKDMSKFVKVGRPQLDHIRRVELPYVTEARAQKKQIVLYAPTWEGTHESMNFTSLVDYGMPLVEQIVNNPDFYLIYKPHPNTGSRDSATKAVNNNIIKLLNAHENGEAILDGDINSLYEHIDLAIFDNSAVAIDYLQINKPMLMTDMFYRIKDRQSKPTIVKAARMLSVDDAHNITKIIKEEIKYDTLQKDRNKIKEYFLGEFDYSKQESTKKFLDTLFDIVDERDNLVEQLKHENEIASLNF